MYVNTSPATTWDRLSPVWRAAVEEAWAAYAAGTVPVGAVLADRDDRIVARGRNRIWAGDRVAGTLAGTRLAHAEVNALLGLTGLDVDARALALYTTTEPCPLCVGAIVMANVREIRYASREPLAGSVTLVDATPYIRSKAIAVHPPTDARLEAAFIAIGTEFHLRGAGPRGAGLVALSREVQPAAVALGERLHAGGAFRELSHLSAADGLERLASALDFP